MLISISIYEGYHFLLLLIIHFISSISHLFILFLLFIRVIILLSYNFAVGFHGYRIFVRVFIFYVRQLRGWSIDGISQYLAIGFVRLNNVFINFVIL